MSSNILELAIIAFIVVGMGVAIWRSGAANPVGTGKLDRRLGHMDSELRGVVSKVGEMERQVEDLDRRAASKGDIKRLEKRMDAQDAKMDEVGRGLAQLTSEISGRTAKVDQIGRTVDRIMDHIVEKGMR